MKLRITQAGFESYTGQMGVLDFIDGLTVGDVLPVDALRIAGIFGAEWENGQAANISQIYLDKMNDEAPSAQMGEAGVQADAAPPVIVPVEPGVQAALALAATYTEEQLAAIADDKGILGLREIADPLGIKGNAIKQLIDGILKAARAQPKT